MTALLPERFPVPPDIALANYNYADIADGTGILALYGAVHVSGAASGGGNVTSTRNYYLTGSTPSSNDIIVSGATIAANVNGYISNNNFDITFNQARDLRGYAFLNISLGGTRPTGSGSDCAIFLSGANIQNFTTGTTLATTAYSEALLSPASGAVNTFSKTILMRFDLTGGPYHFKQNDVLRLNLPTWGSGGSASALIYGGYGADPKDRDDPDLAAGTRGTLSGAVTSQLVLYLPEMLDL